jgi:hypothetical protein
MRKAAEKAAFFYPVLFYTCLIKSMKSEKIKALIYVCNDILVEI